MNSGGTSVSSLVCFYDSGTLPTFNLGHQLNTGEPLESCSDLFDQLFKNEIAHILIELDATYTRMHSEGLKTLAQ